MKKVLSMILCALMLTSSTIFTVGAENHSGFEAVGEKVFIPDNSILVSTYNISENYKYSIRLGDRKNYKNNINIDFNKCIEGPMQIADVNSEYNLWYLTKSAGWANTKVYTYDSTGTYYQKIRVNLSQFSSYFNEDGYHMIVTSDTNETHYYTFSEEDGYNSCLFIASGATISAVAPDEDGMVEFYIPFSMKISSPDFFTILTNGNNDDGYNDEIEIMGIGNVNSDAIVNITDATMIQKYCVKLQVFTKPQEYFGDVNGDGIINILDATEIQKHCAGIT